PRPPLRAGLRALAERRPARRRGVRAARARSRGARGRRGPARPRHRDTGSPARARGERMTEARRAAARRQTKETRIAVEVLVDGSGAATISVPLPFFGHMLETFIRYSGMDVRLEGDGDVAVDAHHLVEDCGLVLGAAVSDALGVRDGIHRFGHAYAPLDEALVRCAIDYGRRPHVVYAMRELRGRINDFDVEVLGEFV